MFSIFGFIYIAAVYDRSFFVFSAESVKTVSTNKVTNESEVGISRSFN